MTADILKLCLGTMTKADFSNGVYRVTDSVLVILILYLVDLGLDGWIF